MGLPRAGRRSGRCLLAPESPQISSMTQSGEYPEIRTLNRCLEISSVVGYALLSVLRIHRVLLKARIIQPLTPRREVGATDKLNDAQRFLAALAVQHAPISERNRMP